MNTFEIAIACGLGSCVLALVFSPIVTRVAKVIGLIDSPGLRKIHLIAVGNERDSHDADRWSLRAVSGID
jgi:hypothetical protein